MTAGVEGQRSIRSNGGIGTEDWFSNANIPYNIYLQHA